MSVLDEIDGGDALTRWFQRVPRFHDAELLDVSFSNGAGRLRIHAWNMTDKVDAKGYFELDRHAIVTFELEKVSAINLEEFDRTPGIVGELQISKVGERYRIEWDASYGVCGFVEAEAVRIALAPGTE